MIFDRALTKQGAGAFDKSVKPELKKAGEPFRIYFLSTMSDFNGQIADYAAWSLCVRLERNKPRPFNELKTFQAPSF